MGCNLRLLPEKPPPCYLQGGTKAQACAVGVGRGAEEQVQAPSSPIGPGPWHLCRPCLCLSADLVGLGFLTQGPC